MTWLVGGVMVAVVVLGVVVVVQVVRRGGFDWIEAASNPTDKGWQFFRFPRSDYAPGTIFRLTPDEEHIYVDAVALQTRTATEEHGRHSWSSRARGSLIF